MPPISKARLEAFSDGVVAIIITIMVLELKVPACAMTDGLLALVPVLISYLLSFVMVGIFWVNHHHLLHTLRQVSGKILWLNLHLLFWLSLLPFCTAYLGAFPTQAQSNALYGLLLCLCGLSYDALRRAIAQQHLSDLVMHALHVSAGNRNVIASALFLMSVPLAHVAPWVSWLVFVLVPAVYVVPGPTIERMSQA